MPSIVRYRKKRYTGRRKKTYRKRRTPTYRTGFLPVQQTDISSVTIPSLGGDQDVFAASLSFNISQLANLTAFVRLFDQYRIKKIKLSMTQTTFPVGNPNCTLYTSVDLDGSPSGMDLHTILQRSNVQTHTMTETRPSKTITVSPRTRETQMIDNVVGNVSYKLGTRGAWIDLADQGTTLHYGLDFVVSNPLATGIPTDITLQYKYIYFIEFRKIR